MAGAYKGVQARILQINHMAMLIHCFAHSLNRALVNSVSHADIPEARNFFSIFEHLVVFVGGSSQRQAIFLQAQSHSSKPNTEQIVESEDEDENDPIEPQPSSSSSYSKPTRPRRSMSDTRWTSRCDATNRYSEPKVFQAAFQTLNHVVKNASDSESKSTALGLIANITSPKFVILPAAFKQVLATVNIVSLFLQAKQIDIAAALEKIQTLKKN